MKIRIKGNSIRLRLSKTEINNFETNEYLEEKTEFGNSTLTYALASNNEAAEISASFIATKITITIPTKIKNEWTTTDIVGFENTLKMEGNKVLLIVIEKDFVCIDNARENQEDNYPNPKEIC